jgi:hypothetical protein
MAANCLAVVLAVMSFLVLKGQNRRADKGEIIIEGLAGFRYTN